MIYVGKITYFGKMWVKIDLNNGVKNVFVAHRGVGDKANSLSKLAQTQELFAFTCTNTPTNHCYLSGFRILSTKNHKQKYPEEFI